MAEIVQSLPVRVVVYIDMLDKLEDGSLRERTRQYVLDPSNFSTHEHQQYRKKLGSDGMIESQEKVGSPYFVLMGAIMGESNSPGEDVSGGC